jgi:nicotinate-nucleotide pyrophosphorylase (carboxylating)
VRQETADDLRGCGLDPAGVEQVVRTALAEDLGPDGLDVTTRSTVPAGRHGDAELVARAAGVVAGLPVAAAVFELVDGRTRMTAAVSDGSPVVRGQVVARVAGPVRALLTAERTALNLLCRLSGVATLTRAFVAAVVDTKARVLDTRKTTPGLRALEKYAVRVAGGGNKRMGLYDVAMVKDNHVRAAGGVAEAFGRVRAVHPDVPVQVEVTGVAEALAALDAGATFLLCDNMTPALLSQVVGAVAGRAELEATGNLSLATVRDYAATGVDYLSVGALTHSAPILDIAMDLSDPYGG